ncbi:MAG: GNAT family N-acetyltransferase [Solobacterium sp.]|nr:GNAT family N-acetyltransferase [Solobacterium sp.]
MITAKPLSSLSRQVHHLYDASFPDNEGIPYRIVNVLRPDRVFTVCFEEETMIGLYVMFFHEKTAYLSCLAVSETLRNKGYGSKILQMIVIDIEQLDETAANSEERKKRRQFCLRSGFEPSGIFYYFFHVHYELLCLHGLITREQYHALIRQHWVPIAETAVCSGHGGQEE